jgi:hypothetical protein
VALVQQQHLALVYHHAAAAYRDGLPDYVRSHKRITTLNYFVICAFCLIVAKKWKNMRRKGKRRAIGWGLFGKFRLRPIVHGDIFRVEG